MANETVGRPWDQKLQEAGARIEEDLRKLVTYLNDEVVPDVRRSGSSALREAAAELQRLAEQMDDRRVGGTAPGGPPDERKRP